jgi:hypothetical protein
MEQHYLRHMSKILAWGLLLGLITLPPGLLVWAFLRPRSRVLQVGQVLALLPWSCLLFAYGRELCYYGNIPYLLPVAYAVLPLALLLNGLTRARRARQPNAYRAWVGVALTGLLGLLELPGQWLLPLPTTAGQQAAHAGLALGLGLLAWVLLVRLLSARPSLRPWLWQPWWRTPALAAAATAGWWALETSLQELAGHLAHPYSWHWQFPWATALGHLLLAVSLRWVAGMVVMRWARTRWGARLA